MIPHARGTTLEANAKKSGRAKSECDLVHGQYPKATRTNHELIQRSTYHICRIGVPVFEGRINKEEQAALDVVDRIVRYGGGVSPFASTGPENLTKSQILDLLRKAKERLDADYLDAVSVAQGRYR